MKLSPCERKILATSTVGRFIRPSVGEGEVSRRGPGWKEHRLDSTLLAGAAETGAGRSLSLQDRRAPAAFELFSGRFRAPVDVSPNYAVAHVG